MPDMTDFDKAQPLVGPGRSKIEGHILPDLLKKDPSKHESLLAALNDRSYSGRTIARVLNEWGYEINWTTIREWRRNNA